MGWGAGLDVADLLTSNMAIISNNLWRLIRNIIISTFLTITLLATPTFASLNSDSYDGNIYALYAGNGSLVPSKSTLEDALKAGRTAVIIYYLDDSSVSKRFAPVVSELQRIWTRSIDLIPLTTDEMQGRTANDNLDPSYYWHGSIPQVVIIAADGSLVFDQEGQIPLSAINSAISKATGLPEPNQRNINQEGSFNEVNIEVIAD